MTVGATILHGAFTPTGAHKFHNVTPQMAPLTDIQVSCLWNRQQNHPQLNYLPIVYTTHTQYSDSLDVAPDFCFSQQKTTCSGL